LTTEDRARQEFERFKEGGLEYIQSLVKDRAIETDILDFKRADQGNSKPGSKSSQDDGVMRNLAKALSGFSNSSGGVVVWGVDCRKHGADDSDTVQQLVPIDNLKAFHTRINALLSEASDPPVVNTEICCVNVAEDSGFLILFIPRNPNLIKSKASGAKDWYVRSGSSFIAMTGAMLDERARAAAPPSAAELELQKLKSLLQEKVKTRWLHMYLKAALADGPELAINLRERLDLLGDTFKLNQQTEAGEMLPKGRKLVSVYNSMNHPSLLVLGSQGAGKTIGLLCLARDLINQNYGLVPVILCLGYWRRANQTLDKWLSSEISQRYKISVRQAEILIGAKQVVLMLDGLDEVSPQFRESVVAELNRFVETHPLIPVVVTCRFEQYQSLMTKLLFQRAVLLEPLDVGQIVSYLEMKNVAAEITTKLLADGEIAGLAANPFILTLIASIADELLITRKEQPQADLKSIIVREHINMALRVSVEDPKKLYSLENTKRWLGYVAQSMKKCNLSFLNVYAIQPMDWLSKPATALYFAPFIVASGFFWCWLYGSGNFRTPFPVFVITLPGILFLGCIAASIVKPVPGLSFNFAAFKAYFCAEVLSAIKRYIHEIKQRRKMIVSFAVAGPVGGAIGFYGREFAVHGMASWPGWLQFVFFISLIVCMIPCLILVVFVTFNLILLIAAVIYPLFLLPGWLSGPALKIETAPNKLIWYSLASGVLNGVIVALIWAVIAALFLQNIKQLNTSLMLLGFASGFLLAGGGAFILHFWLRASLTMTGKLPWNLIAFLDHCADKNLLYHVGSSYKFVDGSIQDELISEFVQGRK
jgi:DNA polymerase III delta prime subunit